MVKSLNRSLRTMVTKAVQACSSVQVELSNWWRYWTDAKAMSRGELIQVAVIRVLG